MREPLSDPEFVAGLRPIPTGPPGQPVSRPAADVVGVAPDGKPVHVRLADSGGSLLLAFLATRCDGCAEFWRGLGPTGPVARGSVEVVVVTKGPGVVDPRAVQEVAARLGPVPVVMSDAAWADYRVSGYPFFVLVDRAVRTVVGESVGLAMTDVLALLGVERN